MAVDFKSLLSRPVESAEKPKPKPAGTYTGIITDTKFDESSKKKTPFCRVIVRNVTAGPNVDQAILATAGDLNKWAPYVDYYLTEDALYRLRELMESLKMKTEGRSFNELIPELKNQPVVFEAVNENITNDQTGEVSMITKIASMKGA